MSQRQASILLMTASGFAGLGYQIVWTQQSALWLGHEAAAVLAVITAFFGGLALGAWLLGPPIEASRRPFRWYAALEIAIACWALLLATLMSPLAALLLAVTGQQPPPLWQWTVAFVGTFLALLPATAAMGATVPAMERVIAAGPSPNRPQERSIGALYAANTFGATVGVLAAAGWLVPGLGLKRTAAICAALNLLCALIALVFFQRTPPAETAAPTDPPPAAAQYTLHRLAITGFLGIGYEVLVIRVLSEVTEDTVYTFAMLLAVYLTGTALGAAAYQRWLIGRRDPQRLTNELLCTLSSACLLGTASLWAAEHIRTFAMQQLGAGMIAAVAGEALLGLIAFSPATLLMGALFSHLTATASAAGNTFGRALGANTIGASAAPIVFGVLALPALGARLAMVAVALGYLALITANAWRSSKAWIPAAAAAALAFWAPPLAFVDVPDGGHIVSYRTGVLAAVSVVEDADGVSRLRINNRQQEGSSSTARFDSRQAWLPLLLHPAPRQALFLGLGTGITASAAAWDPDLQVDAVELLPEVIAASAHFTRLEGEGRRPHLIAADARRYIRTTNTKYDVIISDNFHPARSGSGSLYTVEHFEAVKTRLRDAGIFCQWLPLHQLDLDTLRSIVKSFRSAFPQGWAMLASNSLETPVLGLIGRADGRRFELDVVRTRLHSAQPTNAPGAFGIEDDFALLGAFIAGPRSLEHFSRESPPNTDDHPVVAYRAPRIAYAPDSLPRDRLTELLGALSIDPAELVESGTDTTYPARLSAYWLARNQFIATGRNVRPSADVKTMLAQVQEPLLSVLRVSPEFRPAYDPLITMAKALAHSDAASARALLRQLARAQPARPEAESVLRLLDPTPER